MRAVIRTGQAQAATSPITTFKTWLEYPVMTAAQWSANVTTVQTYASSGAAYTVWRNNNNTSGTGTLCSWTPGSGGQIIGVQATYNRPFIIPWVGGCLSGCSCWAGLGTASGSNAGVGSVPLVSTVIFRNEPFL
jgi:hypothetical protein